jgi:hypothetical protein
MGHYPPGLTQSAFDRETDLLADQMDDFDDLQAEDLADVQEQEFWDDRDDYDPDYPNHQD